MNADTSPPAERPTLGYEAAIAVGEDWAERLAVVAESSPWDTPVPTCPGWDLGKLVRHTGRVHRHVAALVEQRVTTRPGRDLVDFEYPADGAEPSEWIAWYRAGAERLTAVLTDTPSDTPLWSWGVDQHAAFWARRTAHETVIHSVDAHLAGGVPFSIEPLIAVDGLDELLEVRRESPAFAGVEEPFTGSGTVHLHATDKALATGHGEWMIDFTPESYRFTHGHGKGDVAVRAPVETLELLTLGRLSVSDALPSGDGADDGAQIFGDRNVLDRWLAGIRFS